MLAVPMENGDTLFVATDAPSPTTPGGALVSLRVGRACAMQLIETLPARPHGYTGLVLASPARLVASDIVHGSVDVYHITRGTHLDLLGANPSQVARVDSVVAQPGSGDSPAPVTIYAANISSPLWKAHTLIWTAAR
jgi:hypothetical protein